MPAALVGGAVVVLAGAVALGLLLNATMAVTLVLTGLLAVDLVLRARSLLCRRGSRSPAEPDGRPSRGDPAVESVLLRALCHELRSPIGTLTALTRTLADERQAVTVADRRAMLSLARDQAVHLDGVWRQAVAWARGVTEDGEPPVPLARILPAVVAAWPPSRVRLSVSPDAGRRLVNAQRVRQVLLNLVDNALRHGPRRGPVRVTATVRAGDLVIMVADEGQHCADLLAALRRPAPPGGMSGLGLWIVRRLVDVDGGTIRAYPLRPRGVAVEVSLPAQPTPWPDATRRAEPVRQPEPVGRARLLRLLSGWPGWATVWPGRFAVPGTRAVSASRPTGGQRVQPHQGSAVHGEAGRT